MGFFRDVSDLRAAIKANVKAGKGNRSLIEAVEQMPERPRPRPAPRRPQGPLKTFVIWAVLGALWNSRRR